MGAIVVSVVLGVDHTLSKSLFVDNNAHAKEYGHLPGALDVSRAIEVVPDKVRELQLTMDVKTVRGGIIANAVEVVPQRVQCSEGAVILTVRVVTQADVWDLSTKASSEVNGGSVLRIYDRSSESHFGVLPEHDAEFMRAGFTTSGFDVGAVDGVPDILMADRAEPIHVSIGYMADSPCVIAGDLDAKVNGLVAAEGECIVAVAESYERHGDPERLARDIGGCGR